MKASSIKHCLQVCLVLSEGGNHAAEISSGAAVAMTPPMPLRRVPRWQKRVNLSIPRMGNQSTKHLQYQFTRFRCSEMCKHLRVEPMKVVAAWMRTPARRLRERTQAEGKKKTG